MAAMSAYRGGPSERQPDKGGVVEGIVRQFADRYAFVRELVQNAVDAGTKTVRVVVDDAGPAAVVRVEDDGNGMTLEIIEGPLLTLFSSSKEGQKGKIGRYGVGFMSVFALEPAKVIVETWRAGGSFVVTIGRDHGFEVREAHERPGSGTHVSIVLGPESPPAAEVRNRVLEAARRWCRHVPRPIVVTAAGEVHRVNEPFALRAPVVVETKQGGIHALVGIAAGTAALPGEAELEGNGDFAGFYAHGLTLLEAVEPPTAIPGVRFKVASTELAHTISRDDVKRDAGFDRAMKEVRRIVRKELRPELERAQATAAVSWARSGRAAPNLEGVFTAATLALPLSNVMVPLLEPMNDENVISLGRTQKLAAAGRAFAAGTRGPLTRALAERGYAIVRTEEGTKPDVSPLARALGLSGLEAPEARFTIVAEREADANERRLCERVAELLAGLGAPVREVLAVDVTAGAIDRAGLLVGASAGKSWVLPEPGKFGKKTVLLVASHRAVRRAAQISDTRRGPALLVRLLHSELFGPLTPARADRLLESAMEVPR